MHSEKRQNVNGLLYLLSNLASLKRFLRSEVKGQCHSEVKCTFAGTGYPTTYGRLSVVLLDRRSSVEADLLVLVSSL